MLHSKRILSILVIAIMFVGATAQAADQPKLYKVEVVVFEHITQQSLSSEAWSTSLEEPNLSGAIQLQSMQDDSMQPYELLPQSDFQLNREVRKLNNNSNYKILTHVAWIQPVSAPRFAKPVQITGGAAYTPDGQVVLPEPGSDNAYSGDYWQLNGTVTISVMKYLQIQTHLLLTEPGYKIPQQANTEGQTASLISFPMNQTRRTKSKDLNYFDHPLYGMLIEITPYEQNVPVTTSLQSNSSKQLG